MGQATFGIAAQGFFHGRLQQEKFNKANPAAGAGFSIVTSTNYAERWWTLSFLLTTSSHSASREVLLQLTDEANNVLGVIPAGTVQTASLAWQYSFVNGVGNINAEAGLSSTSPMFPMIIPSSYKLTVAITNVDTADQISAIYGYRDRFSTDPIEGYPVGGVTVPDDVDAFAQSLELTT